MCTFKFSFFHSHSSILSVAAREIQPGVEPSARPDAADAEVPGRVETLPREFRPRRFQVFGPAVPSPNAVHGQHGAPLVLLAAGSALAYSHKARFVHSLSFDFFASFCLPCSNGLRCVHSAMIVKRLFDNLRTRAGQKELRFDCFRDVVLDVLLLCCHDPLLRPVRPAHSLREVITRIFCSTFVLSCLLATFGYICLRLSPGYTCVTCLRGAGTCGILIWPLRKILLSIVLHSD